MHCINKLEISLHRLNSSPKETEQQQSGRSGAAPMGNAFLGEGDLGSLSFGAGDVAAVYGTPNTQPPHTTRPLVLCAHMADCLNQFEFPASTYIA